VASGRSRRNHKSTVVMRDSRVESHGNHFYELL